MSADPVVKLDSVWREPAAAAQASLESSPAPHPDEEPPSSSSPARPADEGDLDLMENWETEARDLRQNVQDIRSKRTEAEPFVEPLGASEGDLELYQVWCARWAHAEQIRWTALSSFLGGSTLLVLGWSFILSGAFRAAASRPALIALALAGLVLSVMWLFIGDRLNGFVTMYANHAREAEGERMGPFWAADEHRMKLKGIAGAMQTSRVVIAVPLVFILLFLMLLVVSALAGNAIA